MKSIQMMDRQDLMRILDYIEDTLKNHWGDHEGFQNLQVIGNTLAYRGIEDSNPDIYIYKIASGLDNQLFKW